MKQLSHSHPYSPTQIYAYALAALLAVLPIVVLAEGVYVKAISPGYDIVMGRDMTFKWYDTRTRKQRSYILWTSEENRSFNSSEQEYIWGNFPFGTGRWSVSIYNCKNTRCWIGTTSDQNFYHYNNIPNTTNYRLEPFEYRRGFRSPRRTGDFTVFFELTKDYSIDIASYFTHFKFDDLPEPIDWDSQYEKTEAKRQDLYNYAKGLSTAESDFIKLKNGVLTLKKGYRWDGTSNPGVGEEESSDLRSSCVHDALYDLMRMEYLDRDDENHFNWVWNDPGYMNRLMADTTHFMIAVEDKDKSVTRARSDWRTLRKLARAYTGYDYLLRAFKYHVSDLTAWVNAEGTIDLHWLPANQADYPDKADDDPKNYRNEEHNYEILRTTTDPSTWCRLGSKTVSISDADNYSPGDVYYSDKTGTSNCDEQLIPGRMYFYWIRANDPDSDWDYRKRHYDESFVEAVVPAIGPGNALQLDGEDQYLISTTEPVGPDGKRWTFEAWVMVEDITASSTILSASSYFYPGQYTPLMYDHESNQFCYFDGEIKKCNDNVQVEANQWYHLAVTINTPNEFKGLLYVNGENAVEFDVLNLPYKVPTFGIGASFDIDKLWNEQGGDNGTGAWSYRIDTTDHFKGKIDELRVWNTDLTQYEIKENMYKPLRGDDVNLVALWHFDEPDRYHTAHDATIHGRDAEVHGCKSPPPWCTWCPGTQKRSCFVVSDAFSGPPIAQCVDVTVPTEPGVFYANVSVDNGSYDPDGDDIKLVQEPPGPYGVGDTEVILNVTDESENTAWCTSTVTVVDETSPAICNAPDTIMPNDIPLVFTAVPPEGVDASVEITDFEFYKFTDKGKRIDKTDGAMAKIAGDSITILDSGGVDTHIAWDVVITYDDDKTKKIVCDVLVVNPGKKM